MMRTSFGSASMGEPNTKPATITGDNESQASFPHTALPRFLGYLYPALTYFTLSAPGFAHGSQQVSAAYGMNEHENRPATSCGLRWQRCPRFGEQHLGMTGESLHCLLICAREGGRGSGQRESAAEDGKKKASAVVLQECTHYREAAGSSSRRGVD
eukprot:1140898-Pelagomonas_calceolata.AAC.2